RATQRRQDGDKRSQLFLLQTPCAIVLLRSGKLAGAGGPFSSPLCSSPLSLPWFPCSDLVCDGGASFSDLRTAALLLRLSLRQCVGGLSSPVVQSRSRGGCLCFSSKLGRCLRFVLGLCPWRLGEVLLPLPARKVTVGLILQMVAPPESGRFRVSPPSHPVSSVWTVGWCCLLTSSMALLTVPFMSTLSLLCSGIVLARAWIPISL
ncbi:unnamed protein product, partial [Brassica napus]